MDRHFEVLYVTDSGLVRVSAEALRKAKYRVSGAETVREAEKVINRTTKPPRPGRVARHLGAIILGPSFIFGDNPVPHYKNRDWQYIHEQRQDVLPPGAAVVAYVRAHNVGKVILIAVGFPWHPASNPGELHLTEDERACYVKVGINPDEMLAVLEGPLGQAVSGKQAQEEP